MRSSNRAAALLTSTALVAGAMAAAAGPASARPHRHNNSDVSASLFEWNWASVAKECTTVLGPAGYGAVQVAPPQDSVKRQKLGDGSDTVLHPWWEVYQPTSYKLNSRMGTEEDFKAMVATCRKAGVKVWVDTVINHMTGQGNVSYGGDTFTKYAYRGLYSAENFHSYAKDCPVAPEAGTANRQGSIADFNDYKQVFNCDLVGLSDLDTSQPYVRKTLAGYMNKLLSYGVSGFRVDAAKHMGQTDLSAIFGMLNKTVDGTNPMISLEVTQGSPGRLTPWAFQEQGKLLGFDYAAQLQSAFASYNNPPNDGNIGSLMDLGPASGLLPSDEEIVFVQNHDTDRNASTLTYKSPNNVLANQFMLAYDHGAPQVYSSFAWKVGDDSPPSDANGFITNTDCASSAWACTDRNPGVVAMVKFHNDTAGQPVTNWWDDGSNVLAFNRGRVGFFAANNTAAATTVTLNTGLPGGTYKDRVTGARVSVAKDGTASISLGKYGAVAFTRSDRL